MTIVDSITSLTAKIVTDFSAGAYGSLSKDIGSGFNQLGDLLQTFVGFQAGPGDADDAAKIEKAVADGKACCEAHKAKCMATPTEAGAIDPVKLLSAFQLFLTALSSIWAIFKQPVPAAA